MDETRIIEFVEKVAATQSAAAHAALVTLGDRLDLWKALAVSGPVTVAELAAATTLNERYLQEWLSANAAAGYLTYDPADGRFELPAEHAMVLADDDSPASLIGGFEISVAQWAALDRAAEVFRTGDGVGWHEHDAHLYSGCERFFKPLYVASLTTQWIPALDGVHDKLSAGGRVLDVGCGHGSSAILIAQAYPNVEVVGIDYHLESIEAARKAAAAAGVADRVTFAVADATEMKGEGFDLVCFFDALHDMGDPVGAARNVGETLAEDGTLLVIEPLAGDRLEDNLHPLGVSYYASSTLLCVPNSLSQDVGAALGAQAGPAQLRAVLHAAGFTSVEQPCDAPYNLVLEARR
jgi:SAM-dependent methyltransferase